MNIAKVFHMDHGVTAETIAWALEKIKPRGFFLETLTLPEQHEDLLNDLYGPRSGDEPVKDEEVVWRQRTADRPPSRMVTRPRRKTRLMTIIGQVKDNTSVSDGVPSEEVVVFTCYGGPAAEREVGDPTLGTDEEKKVAAAFWATHALAAGVEEVESP